MEFTKSAAAAASVTAGSGVRLLLSFLFDYTVIIILFGAVAALNFATPFQQHFALQNYTLHYPYAEHERVPDALLYVCSILIPAIIIAMWTMALDVLLETRRAKREMRQKDAYTKGLWELNGGILGLLLANVMAYVVTGVLKNLVGKPRPDFISRCQPNIPENQFVSPVYGLSNSSICTQTDESILNDGFRSFPSGHSSSSFSGLFYLTLYLAGKLHFLDHQGQVWKVFAVFVPTVGASLITVSRIMDARHHPFDVITGSLLGIACAFVAYRQYFPCVAAFDNVGRAYTIRRHLGRNGPEPLRTVDRHSDNKSKSSRAERPSSIQFELPEPTPLVEIPASRSGPHNYEPIDQHLHSPFSQPSLPPTPDTIRPQVPRNSRESKITSTHLTTPTTPAYGAPPRASPKHPSTYDFAPRPMSIAPIRDGRDNISKPRNPRDTLGMSPLSAHILERDWPPTPSRSPDPMQRKMSHASGRYSHNYTVSDPMSSERRSPGRSMRESLHSQSQVPPQPQCPLQAEAEAEALRQGQHPSHGCDRPALCPNRPDPTIPPLSDQDYIVSSSVQPTHAISPSVKPALTIKRKPTPISRHPPTNANSDIERIAIAEFPGSPREDGPSAAVELRGDWSPKSGRSRRGTQPGISVSLSGVRKVNAGRRRTRSEQKDNQKGGTALGLGLQPRESSSPGTWRDKELPKAPAINVVAVDDEDNDADEQPSQHEHDHMSIPGPSRQPTIIGRKWSAEFTRTIESDFNDVDVNVDSDFYQGSADLEGYHAVKDDLDEEKASPIRDLLFGGRKYSFEADEVGGFEEFMGSEEDEESLIHPAFREETSRERERERERGDV